MTCPEYTIGVDPGECTGVAYGFQGVLVGCHDATPDGALELPTMFQWAVANGRPIHALVELPILYYVASYGHPKRATAIGNSLIRESVTLGRWVERLRALGPQVTIEERVPKAWKGSAPKDAFIRTQIIPKLSRDERRLVVALKLPKTKLHNVLDAVGLMLTASGRLEI